MENHFGNMLMATAVVHIAVMTVFDNMYNIFEWLEELCLKLLKSDSRGPRYKAGPHRGTKLMESTDVEIQVASEFRFDPSEFVNDDIFKWSAQRCFMEGDQELTLRSLNEFTDSIFGGKIFEQTERIMPF